MLVTITGCHSFSTLRDPRAPVDPRSAPVLRGQLLAPEADDVLSGLGARAGSNAAASATGALAPGPLLLWGSLLLWWFEDGVG